MLCDACGKNEATYHTIKQINGIRTETHLCAACRKKLSTNAKSGFTGAFFSGLTELGDGAAYEKKRVCSVCGTTEEDFLSTGYLGCERCYEQFSELIIPRLTDFQQSSFHVGKRPKKTGAEVKPAPDEYAVLRAELKKAVDDEDYERAAKIKRKLQGLRDGAAGEVK